MSDNEDKEKFRLHPLQLIKLQVMELSAKIKPGYDIDAHFDASNFLFSAGHSEYDESNNTIAIKIGAAIGHDNDNIPFEMHVDIIGIFMVDDTKFPLIHLKHWAAHNAPLVLYPYLREHVYGLTGRLGVPPVLLPLFEIPSFKVTNN